MLLRHGLPRRPDPGREPKPAEVWERAFSRPLTYNRAEIEIDQVMSDRDQATRSASLCVRRKATVPKWDPITFTACLAGKPNNVVDRECLRREHLRTDWAPH